MACGYFLTECGKRPLRLDMETDEVKRDTVYLTDTIVEVEPIPVSIVSTEIRNRKLTVAKPDTIYLNFPESDTPKDSIEVEVPITQVEYKDSLYQAWVSGFEPKLDSIRIFQKSELITVETILKQKSKKWHIGPAMGVGFTQRGIQPFFGVSLTYSIISF